MHVVENNSDFLKRNIKHYSGSNDDNFVLNSIYNYKRSRK